MDNIQNIFDKIGSDDNHLSFSNQVFVHYISNPDGCVRWIWPVHAKSPLFLKFYHVQGLKAYLFATFIKIIFGLRLQRWIFKKEQVQINQNAKKDYINLMNDHWALFTGTTGPNQKYILYQQHQNGNEGTFTKISLSPKSLDLINQERTVLEFLAKEKNIGFDFPAIISTDRNYIKLSENRTFSKRVNHWGYQHFQFLSAVEKINTNEIRFENFDKLHQISSRIKQLKHDRKKLPSGIVKKLEYLVHSLKNKILITHLAHGDFTPWNTYANRQGELYVYDWELSLKTYPKGFDFFHYFIQNAVLVQKKKWKDIKSEMTKNSACFETKTEFQKYLSLYLLVNVLNYLEIYEKQSVWHTQIHWLLESWNMALSDVLSYTISERELIILDVFDHLHQKKYVGLKLADQPEKISEYSDIDFLISKSVSIPLIKMLKIHPLVKKLKIQSGFAMTKMTVLTQNNQILSLDAIHRLKRKNLEFMSVEELTERPYIDKKGIKKVGLMDMLQFLGLFYGLNHAKIPSRYDAYVDVIRTENQKLDFLINDQFYSKLPNTSALRSEIKKMKLNKGYSFLINTLTYFLDTVINVFYQKGMIITFSGVDGAGKSTVIENTKKEIEKKLRKRVVVFRHRPSLLPILSAWTKGKSQAEKAATETLPRQGHNKSFISSLLRFAYYYTDYVLGQFYIYIRHILRGDVVLYDRYYFDFINDSLRSNITLPDWILKIGYTLLLKPDLNFFLYADAQTILTRKKELDEATIITLTRNYLELFNNLGKQRNDQYQSIENIHLGQTLSHISNTIQIKLIS